MHVWMNKDRLQCDRANHALALINAMTATSAPKFDAAYTHGPHFPTL
jgi:hypothetical protein